MKRIYLIIINFFMVSTLAANTELPIGDDTMFSGKPYFTLFIDVAGCGYEVRMNDVPIDVDEAGLPGKVTLPVNEWLHSGGENTLDVYVGPGIEADGLAEDGMKCRMLTQLQVRQSGTQVDYIPISRIEYHSAAANQFPTQGANVLNSSTSGRFRAREVLEEDEKQGNVMISEVTVTPVDMPHGQGVKISRTIILPQGILPQWAWLSSDVIADNEQTKQELIAQYQWIWDALHSKDTGKLQGMFDERINEYSKALYRPREELDVVERLKNRTQDPERELGEFLPEYAYLKILGNKRLARLVTWKGTPVIFFNKKDKSMHTSYGITFRKSGDKWIITR